MGCGAAGGPLTSSKMGATMATNFDFSNRHSVFAKIEGIINRRAEHVDYDIIRQPAAFC